MVITDIRPIKKGLNNIYIDGEAAVKLDKEICLINHVKIGQHLSDEELLELIKKSELRRAKEKALYILSSRSHSKKELIDKISRTTDREAAKEACEQMEDLGLVNDESFAKMYAKELFVRKKYGKIRVRQELLQKGIDKELILEVLEEYEEDPSEKILEILEKKYSRYKEDEKIKRRAVAALQRMGYNWEEIRRALDS